ncbi:vitamin B12-binding protein [Abditibacteriota bacterium]|nr:vitamin B12-binding protein [Abditibacteriota bacterium]
MFPRFLALGCLALVLAGGCTRPSSAPVGGLKQINLGFKFPDDDLGRPVALKAPAKRVVVIGPGAVETMFKLNAQSQLVGRDSFANYPPAAKKVAVGGDYQGPNVEQCLALRADLVVVQGETSNRARFEDWQKKLGVPVAALTTTNFRSLAADFRKLGAWIGKTTEAEALAKQFEAPVPNYVVIYRSLIQTGDSPGWIAGRGTLVSDAARRAGYGNVADELKIDGYKQISFESLLVHPPDVIIVPSTKPKAQVLTSLRANAALAKLPCVQKGHIVVIDGDLLLRPNPRLLEGVKQLQQQNFGK